MSVPVELADLREETTRFGPTPYLLTVGADGRPHAVSVQVGWQDDVLVARAGRRSVANASERPEVTLLWSPVEAGGYSLILDGSATAAEGRVSVRPGRAILHRSAATGPGDPAASECVPLPLDT